LALHTGVLSKPGMLDAVVWNIDFIEDWSSGKCVSGMHGPQDCELDRYELCAKHMMTNADGWSFVHCCFVNQPNLCGTEGLAAPADDDEAIPACTLLNNATATAQLQKCVSDLSFGDFPSLQQCATNDTSADWAKASGAATAAATQHPLWLEVDGTQIDVTDTNVTAWSGKVLDAVCAAFTKKNPAATAPAACAGL